jgi:hypothetical protein
LLGGGIYLSVIWSRIQAQDEDYYDEHDPCTCGGSMCWAIVSIVSSIIWFVVAFSMFSEGLPSNGAGLIYMAVVMLGVGIFLCVICTRISNRRKGINKAKPRWLKQEMSRRRSPEDGYSNEVASSGPQRAASASSSVPLLSNTDRRGADEEESSAGGAGSGYTYQSLSMVTNNFEKRLVAGGCGSVFQGVLGRGLLLLCLCWDIVSPWGSNKDGMAPCLVYSLMEGGS